MFDAGPPPKLWLPPKPAIIRPAKPDLVKASFLPGMFPAGAIAAARAKTVSFFASATRFNDGIVDDPAINTITFPASIQAGDLIVIHDCIAGNGTHTSVTPSGFTLIGTSLFFSNTNDARSNVSYKIATGSESGSLTVMAGEFDARSGWTEMAVFRGNSAITGVTAASYAGQGSSSTPTTQTVSSGGGAAPLIVFGSYVDANGPIPIGVVSNRGMSPAKDAEITGDPASYMAYKIYNSSPANVDVSMSDEGNVNMLQSFYLALTLA